MVIEQGKRRWFKLSDTLWYSFDLGMTIEAQIIHENDTKIRLFNQAFGMITIMKHDLVDEQAERDQDQGYT